MKIEQILYNIETGDMALPEFQRGYVWNRDQVRSFFSSLYRGYPVGGFMVWQTSGDAKQRGGLADANSTIKLLLDGQQRATSLYGVIRGKPPAFFEGNEKAFTGLHFNVVDQVFEFYAPTKMKGDPAWINVSELMGQGIGPFIARATALAGDSSDLVGTYVGRLSQLIAIKEKDLHIEDVSGSDKNIDIVVDIFNRVNSGGTKLSKGDLTLAKICAHWPEAREQMNSAIADWHNAGFDFRLDWLLRVMNATATGKALFTFMADLDVPSLQTALDKSRKYVNAWLDIIGGRLGLDHGRVLFANYALAVLARHTELNGGTLPSAAERDKLLYWYVHAGMWGRYSGSTETALTQDLDALERGGVDELIDVLRLSRGDLTVRPEDFASGSGMGARFYPTLYMLTRVLGAQDFDTGVPLSKTMLGHNAALEVHHIFPKAALYKHPAKYYRGEVNALSNFCFLTKATNLAISDTEPAIYMPRYEAKQPGALGSQWIPLDPELWSMDRFREFLTERQRLLAEATNTFLESLYAGKTTSEDVGAHTAPAQVEIDEPDERATQIAMLARQLEAAGFAAPELDVEVTHPVSGSLLSIAEAHWPDGLQPGLNAPVVLELDEDEYDADGLAALGYLVFTTIDGLRRYADTLLNEHDDE